MPVDRFGGGFPVAGGLLIQVRLCPLNGAARLAAIIARTTRARYSHRPRRLESIGPYSFFSCPMTLNIGAAFQSRQDATKLESSKERFGAFSLAAPAR